MGVEQSSIEYMPVNRHPFPRGRFAPMIAAAIWIISVMVLMALPDLGDKLRGYLVLTFGLSLPSFSLVFGFIIHFRTRRAVGRADPIISWTLAAVTVLFLVFCFLLLLIVPIYVKSM
jgi:hypothetical protein